MTKWAMVMARGKKEGTLLVTSSSNGAILVASSRVDTTTWHCRLGHMSEKGMKVLLSKGKLSGLEYIDLDLCEDYIFGKQRKVSFLKIGRNPKSERLELVHTDMSGPIEVLSGFQYFVTFIDDVTRKLWVYFLKHKLDAFDLFKKWNVLVENETSSKLKCLRSANVGEY